MKTFTEHDALPEAANLARLSPCAKSKRGAVLFNESGVCAQGYNHPPSPLTCAGDDACRLACSKICVHAEQAALLDYDGHGPGGTPQLLHVKVVDGRPVASGPPSCWQCSKLILATSAVAGVWLLHDDGLKLYDPLTFHLETLRNCSLPEDRKGREVNP